MADFFCSAVLYVLYSAALFCVYFPGGKLPFPGRKKTEPFDS